MWLSLGERETAASAAALVPSVACRGTTTLESLTLSWDQGLGDRWPVPGLSPVPLCGFENRSSPTALSPVSASGRAEGTKAECATPVKLQVCRCMARGVGACPLLPLSQVQRTRQRCSAGKWPRFNPTTANTHTVPRSGAEKPP